MKIYKFAAAAMSAAMIFSACTKENANGPKSQRVSKATINVNFDLNSKVRAIDPIDNGVEQTEVSIQDACIFLIEGGDGTIADSKYVDNVGNLSSTGVLFEDVTTAVSEVFVVTNTGNIIGSMTKKSEIAALLKSLGDLETAYSGGKIWSYGSVTVASSDWVVTEDTTNPEETVYTSRADVSITEVNPILSRVDFVVKVGEATNWVNDFASATPGTSVVVLKGAALLYSAAYTHYIYAFTPSVAALGSNKALVSGLLPEAGSEWYNTPRAEAAQYATAGAESFLYATWKGSWKSSPNFASNQFSRSFYALAPNDVYTGSSVAAKPIIAVYGLCYTWDADASEFEAPEMLFWPIHFDGEAKYGTAQKTLTMENGMRYVVTVNLKGDLSKHKVSTPEKRYLADVNVTVSEAKWKSVISIDETFDE